MKQSKIKAIEIFLDQLDKKTEIDVTGLVAAEDIDIEDPYQSIYKQIDDNNGFDIDIIYYSEAIKYLAKNDPSLRECMAIASEYGYECKNLNSETLASLLASFVERENFSKFKDEINDFFEELTNEDEDSE